MKKRIKGVLLFLVMFSLVPVLVSKWYSGFFYDVDYSLILMFSGIGFLICYVFKDCLFKVFTDKKGWFYLLVFYLVMLFIVLMIVRFVS